MSHDLDIHSARDCDDEGPHLVDVTLLWNASGGAARRYLLAKRAWFARETSWSHTIVAPTFDDDAVAHVVDCGGLVLPGTLGLRVPLRRRAAARLIERQAPDLIEVGDASRLAWAALDAAQRLGVPSVAFCHVGPNDFVARLHAGRAIAARAARAYLRRLYAEFDLLLAPCDAIARELRELGLSRVQRQPLGIDTGLFHPGRRDEWVRSLGVAPDTRVLVYAGAFAPARRLALLADAVRALGPRYLLVALGSGAAPPRGRQVMVLPPPSSRSELARVLASADAFVDLGEHPGGACAALEALACGTPLVMRADGPRADVVVAGAGVAARGDSAQAWAEAIAELFAVPRDCWTPGARARALEHDWDIALAALHERYRRLLDMSRLAATTSARFSFGEATQPAVLWHAPIAPASHPDATV